MSRQTTIDIDGDRFMINGQPTYEGRFWKGMRIEGLLLNSRMVQGAFDDLNPETRPNWNYPDGPWDPERNNREFIQNMSLWRRHGLLSFTINFQGGSPRGYSKEQPWHNSSFDENGELRLSYLARLERILDEADELGMAPIVGIFYFGQDWRFEDERAVVRACDNATDWLIEKGYTNVLIEVANEVNIRYVQPIIQTPRAHELMERVKQRSAGKVKNRLGRFHVGNSMGGDTVPPENVVAASDYILMHGNGVEDPNRIRRMVDEVRERKSFRGQPVVFNEDDHFNFDRPDNNMLAAIGKYASWGYFDYRMPGEGYDEGYQSVPVNWGISSERKRGFFRLLAEVTGSTP